MTDIEKSHLDSDKFHFDFYLLPGKFSAVWFPVLVCAAPETNSRLLGRPAMKFLICALLVAASYVAAASAEAEVKVEEGVLVATVDNFKQLIADNEFVLVEFCKYKVAKVANKLPKCGEI